MKRIVSTLLLALAATLFNAEDYTLGPDSQPQDGVQKGTVTAYTLKPGKFYPSTPHKYSVYVPAQYDAAKPTPFMIFLDGSGALGSGVRVPVVFDNLIAKHDIPAMIGIFIDPGVLPALSEQAQNRYERIFEYDSLSDRLASFLLEELIPEVGKSYNLSKNPDERGIYGVSTGAVGAFMTAWNRPDQFHRVLSFIGTYVAMKGADSLPAMVRKTEPKPIRIFMQDGTNDHIVPAEPFGTSFSGSWPMNNRVMYEALEYSGYDAKLVMGTEAHNMKQGGAIMPDALRWLWRDYPQPIVVHEPEAMHKPGWDPRGKVYETVFVDKPWQQIGGDYGSILSVTADRNGNVYFPAAVNQGINRADAEGKVTEFAGRANFATIVRMGADDRLYAYLPSTRSIVSYSTATGAATDEKTVAKNLPGAEDFVLTQKGSIYYLNGSMGSIGYIDPAGNVTTAYRWTGAGSEMAAPGGLALSPDQAMLIVTDAQSRFSWSFQIAADGSLANGEPFYRLEMPETGWMSQVTGVATDAGAAAYFATPLGIQVCEPSGRVIEILNSPGPGAVSRITFAGANPAWLYAVEAGKLYRRPVKITPAYVWAPAKPPKPLL